MSRDNSLVARSIPNPEFQMGFDGLYQSSLMSYATISNITDHIKQLKPDVTVIEMPAFSQTAKSALAIGMCWGAITEIETAYLIPPSALKIWSGSKRGDGKSEVKRTVLERVFLDSHQQRNDNVVDAVGICLMVKDYLYKLQNEIL